jgi:protein-tyrosine phosphatase
MIDLHCHILPAVDDGARTLDEAVLMCRMAADDGCRGMVATPHQRRGEWWNSDRGKLERLAGEISARLDGALQVYLGGEVRVDSDLLSDVERFEENGILPLAGSRYLLIEFPTAYPEGAAVDLVHELSVAGWRPVVAHPEFIPWLAEDPDLLGHLVDLGATAQVTAMSVTGDFGKRPQRCTHALLDADLVHFVASDSHDTHSRPPGLKRAYAAIAERWGEPKARRLTFDHPQAVVEDRPLPQGER